MKATIKSVWVANGMCGMSLLALDFMEMLTFHESGAYCAMTIVSLLDLPISLPSSSPARSSGHETFQDGLIAWIGRCKSYLRACRVVSYSAKRHQVKHMKVDYQVRPEQRLMVHMRSARLRVFAYLTNHTSRFTSKCH